MVTFSEKTHCVVVMHRNGDSQCGEAAFLVVRIPELGERAWGDAFTNLDGSAITPMSVPACGSCGKEFKIHDWARPDLLPDLLCIERITEIEKKIGPREFQVPQDRPEGEGR